MYDMMTTCFDCEDQDEWKVFASDTLAGIAGRLAVCVHREAEEGEEGRFCFDGTSRNHKVTVITHQWLSLANHLCSPSDVRSDSSTDPPSIDSVVEDINVILTEQKP